MKPLPSRSRRPRRWLYAAYLGVVASLALCGTGLFAAARMREQASQLFEITGPFLSFEPDPDGGALLTPNAATRMRMPAQELDFHVYTDARGFRVRAPGAQTPAQVDLLLAGDSFFFGWGVSYDESVPALLEARTGLRVASSSVPAANTLGAALQIERNRDLRPRWIAYDIIDLHLARNVCPCVLNTVTPFCDGQYHVAFDAAEAPYVHEPIASFLAPRHGTRRAFEAILRERATLPSAYWGLRVLAGGLYRKWFHPCAPDPAKEERATRYALEQLIAASRSAGAELIVMYVPDLSEPSGEGGRGPLPALVAAYGREVTFIDLGADVNAHFAQERVQAAPLRLTYDSHPSAAGHVLMARALCRALAGRARLAPEACEGPRVAGDPGGE